MSADSTAASTDSVSASADVPLSATTGVVKIANIPLPDDRPHTISSAIYQPPVRPLIIADTFEPLPVTAAVASGPPARVAEIYSRPSLVNKDSHSTVAMPVATPTVPVTASLHSDCSDAASGGEQPSAALAQHSSAVPSALQKRKTVSSTDVLYSLSCM